MDVSSSEKTPGTWLITGATGFIGARLASLALEQGYLVKTLTRSDWADIPAVPVDQRYFGSLPGQIPTEALKHVDAVIHCAASFEGAERIAYAVNVEGTIRLAQLAREAGVKSFIFLSSQSALPNAISAYGKTKRAAEQALLGLNGLNVIVLRPGLVTGHGSRGLFQRMSRMVETLPVVPLLGGSSSIVQPIHVDDLCEAIFRCEKASSELNKSILHLGHPEGLSLVELLQAISLSRLGRRKLTLPIPLWLAEVGIGLAEALHIPLPISTTNLKGLKIAERMETTADLARLNLSLRPLDKTISDGSTSVNQPVSLKERAVRILLIGAGRIGLVHAITISRLPGVVLSGVVDPKADATRLYIGLGLPAPMFGALDEALAQARPDAAVIATPGVTHLPLSRKCLAQGVSVMIEKPLAIREEQLAEYERLAREFPNCAIRVGYVMPRSPQIAYFLDRLRAGLFGKVKGFLGATLISGVQAGSSKRWEVNKNVSGGGALINSGGHILSVIRAAFGNPQAIEAETVKLYSAEVEDSIVVSFTYADFSGRHYCSWSINGYPIQENRLNISTELGRLILTSSMGAFISNDGEVELKHQLDYDVGFNLAPDYLGAGFSAQVTDLKEAVRSGQPATRNLTEAIQLERLIFKVYDVSREVEAFTASNHLGEPFPAAPLRLSKGSLPSKGAPTMIRRALDLRDLSPAQACAYLCGSGSGSGWDEYLLTPTQMKALPGSSRPSERLRVTVPDFLNEARLLSTRRYGEILKRMSLGGIMVAARAATPLLIKERAPTFWVAAMGLLGAGLESMPTEFQGTILLHGYLTDLALSLRRLDVLGKMLIMCRRIRPQARVGFHTNIATEALNALHLLDAPIDELSVSTSPHAVDMAAIFGAMRRVGAQRGLRLTAEVGLAPSIVHREALNDPQRWAFGADAVLIGIGADPVLAGLRQREVEREWSKVFPGLSLPEGVL